MGYTEVGALVEWIPDKDNPGSVIPEMRYRNMSAVNEAVKDFCFLVRWTRMKASHQNPLSVEEPLADWSQEEFDKNENLWNEIAAHYGHKQITSCGVEWGIMLGRMSALCWIFGMEWEESLDEKRDFPPDDDVDNSILN